MSEKISFGSVWWPPKHEHIWILIDVLIELHTPFVSSFLTVDHYQLLPNSMNWQILSHPSQRAVIPPSVSDQIKASGTGLLISWAPSQTILKHLVNFVKIILTLAHSFYDRQ